MLVREEQEYLEALARSLGANYDVTATSELLEGPVCDAIARYVREVDIDLVVMSTHGHGGLRRAWLGSNADRLLRKLRVPMLLIRPIDSITPVDPIDNFKRVLIAFDGSAVAEAAMDAAAELPFADGAHCTLMRVAIAPLLGSAYLPDAARDNQQALEEKTEAAERYLETIAPQAAGHWPIVDRHVVASYRTAESILDHADRVHADLIVIGTHGRTRLGRAVLGGVADKVIRGADLPIFVYPARALSRNRQSADRARAHAFTV